MNEININGNKLNLDWAMSKTSPNLFKIPMNDTDLITEYEQIEDIYKKFFLTYIGSYFVEKKYLEYLNCDFYEENFDDDSMIENFKGIEDLSRVILSKTEGEERYFEKMSNMASYCENDFNKEIESNELREIELNSNDLLKRIGWI